MAEGASLIPRWVAGRPGTTVLTGHAAEESTVEPAGGEMLSPAVPRAGNSGLHPRTIVSGLNWYIGKMPTGRVVPSRAEHTETTGIGDLRLIVRNAVATLLYAVPGADTVG